MVLVELKARVDEENNIEWSRRLEEAGCTVIYGLDGYKVHSKLCLITKKTNGKIEYYTQIGTGNYNEKTARLYTDLSLMTHDQEIGEEAAAIFQALFMGETVQVSKKLLVAPNCLQNRLLDMIEEEIRYAKRGEEAYIGVKMNSLTDKKLMDKLIEASQAGVEIELIVRGICCLIPGVEAVSYTHLEILEKENIFVMDEHRATHQDIRLIKIGLLNLMPLKEDTELQILRSLSNLSLIHI